MTATRYWRGVLMRALTIVLTLGFVVGTARAQTAGYPNRPIKMIVGFAAGGSTDVAARIVAQKMSEILGQSVVVENRTGASGLIAAEDVVKSPPDGYTLMMASQTVLAVAPRLYRKVTVDPVKDFAPVVYCGASPLVLVVNPSFPAHTVADVIAMAKAQSGQDHFRHRRRRHDAAYHLRNVSIRRRHQDDACALSRRSRRDQRSRRRANPGDVRQPLGDHGPYQGRHGARDRGHEPEALALGAGHSDRRGNAAGICRRDLVRHRRAGRNAARHDCQTQRRGAASARPARTPRSATPISA